MENTRDRTITRGQAESFSIKAKQADDSPMHVGGFSFICKIKQNDGSVLATYKTTVEPAEEGNITFSLTPEVTSQIPLPSKGEKYLLDLVVTNPLGRPYQMPGVVTVIDSPASN